MRSPRRTIPFFLAPCAVCLVLAGCRNHRDLTEAELRTRERDLYTLRDELSKSEAFNESLRREVSALRGIPPSHVGPGAAPQSYAVTTVTLGRQTGGYDADEAPGDEALQVIIEPKDPDGHTIKAPGTVEVQAFEITREGLKVPLSTWHVSADQLRRSWRSGLLSTGYSLILPWQVWPSTEKLRVVVHFKLDDGRLFEADKDVTVRIAPERKKVMPPADGIGPQPELVPPPVEFKPPPPRKLEGPAPFDGWNDVPLSGAEPARQHRAAASPLAAELLRPTTGK
jgi:hypothetical protein